MPIRNLKYPHLLPPDIPVWERYLAKYGHQFSEIDYDIQVGKGRDPGDDFQPNIRNMALNLSRRRIDAVVTLPGKILIIEITTLADMVAVGQMILYPILYQQTYNPIWPIEPLLICERLGSDIEPALRAAEIPWVTI